MKLFTIILFVLLLLMSCEDDTSGPQDNTQNIDTLYAEVRGDYDLTFATNTVNLNVYPNEDTTLKLVSGTIIKGPDKIYDIYFMFPDAGNGKMNYGLDTTGRFTRFEITHSVLGSEKLDDAISGSLQLIQNNNEYLEGSFHFQAQNIDSNKTVNITNGYFKYKVFD